MANCNRCLMDDSILGVTINAKGVCNFCELHDRLNAKYPIGEEHIRDMVARIKKRGKKHRFDCLIGISGGADSSYLLHLAKQWGLRALAFHFDNTFNTDIAEHNMKVMLNQTGFPCVRISVGRDKMLDVNKAVLMSSVSDADIPNDIAMAKLMLMVASENNVKTILNGHSFREEGSVPIGWTYMDGAYLKDLYRKQMVEELKGFPILTVWDQIKAGLNGICHDRPLYHIDHDKHKIMEMLQEVYGWQPYYGRHTENIYTEFAGWSIYERFGIDKRIIELSAKIRSGKITHREALIAYHTPVQVDHNALFYVKGALGLSKEDWRRIDVNPRKYFFQFKTYHKTFRRLRWLIWLGVKLGMLPQTFFDKYTKRIAR